VIQICTNNTVLITFMWQIYACAFDTQEAVKKSGAFYGTCNCVIRYQNRPLLVPVLSQTNPVYIPTLRLLVNILIQTLVLYLNK
jgi:hypothetical protein